MVAVVIRFRLQWDRKTRGTQNHAGPTARHGNYGVLSVRRRASGALQFHRASLLKFQNILCVFFITRLNVELLHDNIMHAITQRLVGVQLDCMN